MFKFYNSVAVFNNIDNFRFKESSAENKTFSDFCVFSGTNKDFPDVKVFLFKKKKLDWRMCVFPFADKSCRNNSWIIEYKKIPRFKKIDYFIKMFVFNLARFSVEVQF